MNVIQCLKEFEKWSDEAKQACFFVWQKSQPQSNLPEPQPRDDSGRRRVGSKNGKRWSDDDRLELFALFDRYGWDHRRAKNAWSRQFGRSVKALHAQFDKDYQTWLSSGKDE